MPGVKVFPGDHPEKAERKFRKQVEKAGILQDLRKHEYYEKPSVKRKRKSIAARKRVEKQLRLRNQR